MEKRCLLIETPGTLEQRLLVSFMHSSLGGLFFQSNECGYMYM